MTIPPRSPTAPRNLAVLAGAACVLATVPACSDSPTDTPGDRPTVTAISPAPLTPGGQATVEGSNFAGSVAGNTVTVWGTEVTVEDASEASLTVRLPDFLCGPEGEAPVLVTVNEQTSDEFRHPFDPGADGVTELAVGEFLRIPSSQPRCLLLGERGSRADYLVGVQSTTETESTVTGVQVRGMRGGSVAAGETTAAVQLATPGSNAPRGSGGVSPLAAPPGADAGTARWLAAHRRAESRLRRAEAELLSRRPALGAGPSAAASSARPSRVPATVEPGDTLDLNVPDISEDDFCEEARSIRAVVRRLGDNSIIVEDVENPEDGFDPEDFDFLADEFDNHIYDELVSHFGPPTDLDENGRVVIVVSESVNRVSSTAVGFVVSVDFFPDDCPGGNGGEYYYARAPDPDGTVPGPDGETGDDFSANRARELAPLLLAHEVTHVVQFGRRFTVPGRGSQAIWIMEGQATYAEEVVGHSYSGFEPRSNMGPSVVFDEYPPANVSWYANGIFGLVSYFGLGFENVDGDDEPFRVEDAPHRCTWLSVEDHEPCDTGLVAYGTAWSLLRWMSDHFADEFDEGDAEFQRAIINSSRSGFAVFEELLGLSREEFLALWAATLYADDRVQGTPDPLVTFPSWNLQAVEDGVIDQARLVPAVSTFSDFESDVEVAAASSYYQVLRGVSGHPPFALAAETSDGGALPDHMQLWVVRLR